MGRRRSVEIIMDVEGDGAAIDPEPANNRATTKLIVDY